MPFAHAARPVVLDHMAWAHDQNPFTLVASTHTERGFRPGGQAIDHVVGDVAVLGAQERHDAVATAVGAGVDGVCV